MAIQDEISLEMRNLATFFKWFYPLEQWADMIMIEILKNTRARWIVIIFYKPQYFMQNGPAKQLGSFPSAWIHKSYFSEVSSNILDYRALQKYLCQLNKIIPSEIWPTEGYLAPWDKIDPLKPYQEQLRKALMDYQTDIPDPKEWSQDYPWYCSSAYEETLAWKDLEQLEIKRYRTKEENKRKIKELNVTSDISTD
ncbi:hypothetical protein Gotri_011412, partial [Gossypium trilobum]|nr:hypothetical protein [Gossypium trilobum]